MPSTDLVTIVATDWVESTATRSRLGEDRADELQKLHDAILRDIVEKLDGHVVKNSGDGVLATFHSATDALAAAIAIQQRFDSYSANETAIAPVKLRVGISAGDVVHRDGDIFGTPIIEAVRLEGAATAGQILCSELTRILTRGRGGFDFELMGLLELKGLAEPLAVCRVNWERTESATTTRIGLPEALATDADAPFVGRAGELQTATEVARQAEQTQAVWLLGEPGIGKTRLAAEIATGLHADGALVLYGRCDEQVPTPFQPVIDALRWLVAATPDDELLPLLGADPDPLVRLVPELHARLPELRLPDLAREAEQYRLFESVRSCLGVLAAETHVVFVVDDVHWADRPTLALLGHIVRHAQPAQLTMLATARDTDPDVSDPLTELMDDLERSGRSRRLSIAGLDAVDVAALVGATRLAPRNPERFVAQLTDETAGNPLFVGAVLAGANADGSLPTQLPTDVRAAVRRRVARLDAGVNELLQVAALVGLEFSLGVASDAAHIDDADGLTRVEQAVSAGLVEEIAIDHFRFMHALVRDALEAELSASRSARLHAAIGRAVEARFGAEADGQLRALAHHYAAAGSRDLLERALDYASRAARRSIEMLAFDAAVEDYSFALELADQLPDFPDASRFELLSAKGNALFLAGSHPAALELIQAAVDNARARGDWEAFANATLAYEETNWRPGLLGHRAAILLREALGHDLPEVLSIRIEAALGRALHYSGAPDAQAVAGRAVEAARRLGDPELLAATLAASIQTLAGFRDHEVPLALEQADEIYAMEELLHREDVRLVEAAQYAAVASLCAGNRTGFEVWFERVQTQANRVGLRFDRYVAMCDGQVRSFLNGDLAEAEAEATTCQEFGAQLGEDVSGVHGVQMFLIRREQGRLSELAPVVRLLLRSNPTDAMWGPGLVLLLAEIGMHDDGARLLTFLTSDGAAAVPRDALFPGALCLLSEAAFRMGDVGPVDVLTQELQPWRTGGVPLGHSVAFIGSAARYLAMLACLSGRYGEAEEQFANALAFNRGLGSPVWVAHTLSDWAGLRIAQGDAAGARPLVGEARDLADRHGLGGISMQLDQLELEENLAE